MIRLDDKEVLVVGLGVSGVAASRLLRNCGARVTAVDGSESEPLRAQAEKLRELGVRVELGTVRAPSGRFS